jgi:hypothetical protein
MISAERTRRALAAGTASLTLAALAVPAAHAQATDAEALRQMRQELDALRTEQSQAKAAEQARAQRMDALARQLARASGEPIVETPPVTEIPAQATSGWPRSDGGRKFEIYGFAQADYIHDFDRVDNSWDSALRPSKIPTTKGQFGANGQDITSVKQSRFGVQASQPVGGKDLFVKFEFDLFGTGVDAGQTTFRLRHIYGTWGPLLAGQTNSLFMDGDTFPNTIEYWGPIGMVFLRNPQVRYTWNAGTHHRLAVAIEKPGNDIDPGDIRVVDPALGSALQASEELPDITAQYRYTGDWGHVQLAGIMRRVGFETIGTVDNEPKNHKFGWGVNLTSNIKVFDKDVIHLAAVYGEGIASYMNDGGTDLGPKGRAVILPNGQITGLRPDVVPTLGLMAYYDHAWNDRWSSSIGWSQHQQYNLSFQSPTAFQSGQYASLNLLWTPAPRIMMGGEFLWGLREDNDGNKGEDTRIQLSFKYAFSSDDFR